MVDFGLAQTYDRTSENIFDYEKLNKNKLNTQNENSPAKKNLIAINLKKNSNTGSHLVLTTPKKQSVTEGNSLPHVLSKDKNQLTNSQSFDCNLDENVNKSVSPTNSNNAKQSDCVNSPKPKTNNTVNLQKYYSFQKPSFSISENKCTCFNMPFVCEICTTRYTMQILCLNS